MRISNGDVDRALRLLLEAQAHNSKEEPQELLNRQQAVLARVWAVWLDAHVKGIVLIASNAVSSAVPHNNQECEICPVTACGSFWCFFDSVRLEVSVQRLFCQLPLVSRRGPSPHTES